MTPTWWRTDAVEWQAGGWTLEVRGDEIADIRHHGIIVLRAVRAVVRDRGWETVPVAVRRLDRGAESFELALQHEGLGARVSSTLTVATRGDELSIVWSAVSAAAFDTCRTGLVALHPPSEAGRDVVVVHSDGSTEATDFPVDISPHQPIRDIRELRIDGGARISFTGDVFEMEDQRNWTDASFKTYSRPLDLPYPYVLGDGETVEQTIIVSAPADRETRAGSAPEARIDLTEGGSFPEIGVEASTAPDPVPVSSAGTFRIVELDLTTRNWRAVLDRAARDERPLDVRLICGEDDDQVGSAAAALTALTVPLLRVAAFDKDTHVTSPAVGARVIAALRAAGIDAPFASGARSHFTELNRERDSISRDAEAIVVTVSPLFHALDTEQLVESVAMQRLVAEQAVRIADGLDVHIGPVSLRPRFNNVATTPQPAPSRTNLSAGYGAEFTGASDERQGATELAAWVIASAAALAVRGVSSLSWFETWGPRGIADQSGRLPVAEALDALVELQNSVLLSGASPDGLLWSLGGRCEGADILLVANMDRRARVVRVKVPGGAVARRELAAGSWARVAV
ncbi:MULTISPECIES: hypothetical protein [unclassified Microbacterium]|uniref:hypothetical protein n=1 Tax=unclassified Microbacterium TaxID=2609290 RepID=UPI000EA9B5E4|nr:MULTISPECIES: hypothetical protein [unclassified Microbacterium]MBT2486477.1 hypothetical protein [Microbacterium sp. ISL-108]RKN69175.1 hypothetical protein D7252_17395 [Microbacterium sp. CGR2]